MDDRNNRQFTSDRKEDAYLTSKSRGPQGIDKAPGEETAGDTENVVAETQKR